MAGGEKLVILAILIAAASGAGYAGRTHWVSKPKAVPPIVRAHDPIPEADRRIFRPVDPIPEADLVWQPGLKVVPKPVHVDRPVADPHAALERTYRANLEREGLVPRTTHEPAKP